MLFVLWKGCVMLAVFDCHYVYVEYKIKTHNTGIDSCSRSKRSNIEKKSP